uniref:Uncharacterized protein n=1 Tax=Periophthalmus magnuspinnatus TaxID=409849 RepID=A0A3B4BIR6_9GOBI
MKLAGPLLCVCLDLLLVSALWTAQHSAFLSLRPWVWLWAGGVCRAVLLLLFCGSFPGLPSWMQEARGLQSVAVLCFHFPLYTSLLWALGQPSVEELWSCHSWTRVSTVPSLLPCYNVAPSSKTCLKVLGVIHALFESFLQLMAFPQYTGRVADWIMNKEAPDAFTEAITNMVLMTVASAILELFCDLTYNVTMSYIHTFIQAEVFQAVLKQDIRFFHTTTTGELVSRITTDTNDMSEALSEKLSLLMWYSARFVFLLAFMVWQSWKLTLLTCMALPIIWVIPELIGNFQQVRESLAKANQVATETFSNMKTVRSFANEEGETERYKNSLDKTYSLNKKEATAYAGMTWANSLTTLALKVCILYYGGTLVTRGAVSGGDLVSFILYELQFTSAVEAVMRYFPEVKKAVGASEKIFQYLDRIPQIPPDGTLAPETLEKEIEFKNVKFSYSDKMDDNNLVLKGASFKILLGKTNALLGLNQLLERFYQPQEGVILLDGQPLQSYRNQYLHEKIAVVSQDCLLFARSVDENIRYGFEKASEEDMKRAAELACAHGFITDLLSDGYNTDAGERGGQVSGGQKQRIAIARALIRQPQILILDNATSDLDAETEKKVYEAVLHLPNHCTVLLISNKMDIGQSADHIVYLHEGAVSEEGSHDELMELKGHYARLVDQQNAGFHRRTEHS